MANNAILMNESFIIDATYRGKPNKFDTGKIYRLEVNISYKNTIKVSEQGSPTYVNYTSFLKFLQEWDHVRLHFCSVEDTQEVKTVSSNDKINNQVDFAYFAGVFNVSGINGLMEEIKRLEKLGKHPHQFLYGLGK